MWYGPYNMSCNIIHDLFVFSIYCLCPQDTSGFVFTSVVCSLWRLFVACPLLCNFCSLLLFRVDVMSTWRSLHGIHMCKSVPVCQPVTYCIVCCVRLASCGVESSVLFVCSMCLLLAPRPKRHWVSWHWVSWHWGTCQAWMLSSAVHNTSLHIRTYLSWTAEVSANELWFRGDLQGPCYGVKVQCSSISQQGTLRLGLISLKWFLGYGIHTYVSL